MMAMESLNNAVKGWGQGPDFLSMDGVYVQLRFILVIVCNSW